MKKFIIFLLFLVSCSNSLNIDTTVKTGNEGFVIGNGDVSVLLTHGLAASPYEVKGLSEYLAARNITVSVLRLDGHGTSAEDLATKNWNDWHKSYDDAYTTLKKDHKKVFVGGVSLGGLLALDLAEHENVSGVIALAPALEMTDARADYAWLLKYFVKYSKRTIPEDRKPYYYDRFTVAGVADTVKYGDIVGDDAKEITSPILIMQYTNDTRSVSEESIEFYNSVSSEKKELDMIDGTGHVFLLDDGKERYFETIYQFIKANS